VAGSDEGEGERGKRVVKAVLARKDDEAATRKTVDVPIRGAARAPVVALRVACFITMGLKGPIARGALVVRVAVRADPKDELENQGPSFGV